MKSRPITIKLIDIFIMINHRNHRLIPKKIRTCGMIWTYEQGFEQYKNDQCQELIKYLRGDYWDSKAGLTYGAILNHDVEIVEEEVENVN